MRLHTLIFRAIRALLTLDAKLHGRGSAYTLANDLACEFIEVSND